MKTSSSNTDNIFAGPPTYWLTRFVLLRLLGILYAIAFLVLINQVMPLLGSNGLLPAEIFIRDLHRSFGSTEACFLKHPSLFWFVHSDTALLTFAWTGLVLSLIVIAGFANVPLLTILWFIYMSFVHIGQEWYGYGWEIQLIETGFLSIFLCPFLDMRPFPKHPPPFPVIVLFRWLCFRVMLGAGLIKIRGDVSWLNGTALYHHFETQPIPGPLSRWFHFLPVSILKMGVWFNFIAELAAPWFVFWPRLARHIAGAVIVLFQLSIILSGNLSFLNWLTILPALACFDDRLWSKLLPAKLVRKAALANQQAEVSQPMQITVWMFTILLSMLSIQPALNLLNHRQMMNASFEPFNTVNTYGAFGSVGQERLNVVFEGTADTDSSNANWKEYPYRGLPVAPGQSPPQIAPYQLHFDWQMWFAAMGTPYEYEWTYNLCWKLLHNDRDIVDLFAANPFPAAPPRYIRAVLYRYSFAPPGNRQRLYWNREKIGLWLPPLSVNNPQLLYLLKNEEWLPKNE